MRQHLKTLVALLTAIILLFCNGMGAIPQAAADEVEIDGSWQLCTLRNRILGVDLSFYLPEGEWSISNLTVSANTSCYFIADGASVRVNFLAVAKDLREAGDRLSESVFTTEAEGRQLTMAGEHPAYIEDGNLVIHLGDLPMAPDVYFLQAVLTPEDDGNGQAYVDEMFKAIAAAPRLEAFDTGFPADRLVDDSGTMFYPEKITYNGTDILLEQSILLDASMHVQGIYVADDGTTYTVITSYMISRASSFEKTLNDTNYKEVAYGEYRAAEKWSYRTLYVSVWMGDHGCKFQCKYDGDETDAKYEIASGLIQALAASGEYRPLPEE